MKNPVNSNYCASVVEVKNTIPIDNCDNVVHTNIFGNLVIVSKDTKVGDVGLYFPPETQISNTFLSKNNLFRHSENNDNKEKKGFFEDSGRVRTVKFRGNSSVGFFIPINSLENAFDNVNSEYFKVGSEFDFVGKDILCKKYIVKVREARQQQKKSRKPKESKIIENQFRFHEDTKQLYKNIQKIKPNDIISVTYKQHGTSLISSRVLCKKKLNPFLKLMKFVGVPVVDKQYDNIYSSRRVVKNSDLNPNAAHYYETDIWGLANEKLKDYLLDGMTFYAEIVGYVPNKENPLHSTHIQKDYDYGCEAGQFEVYIYRITYTNPSGNVFEFSAKQVQEFCIMNGLNVVPELYYGRVIDLDESLKSGEHFHENLLAKLKEKYNEKDCFMCKNTLPEEGAVVRIERVEFEAYKLKSERFYERETKLLDKCEVDIEES